MATQKITPFAVPAQSPQISRQPESVTQEQLARIITLRQQIKSLESQLEEAQVGVRAALEARTEVEPGLFRAYLKTTERRNVSWKQVCERELGEAYCVRVLAATKSDKFTNLVVTA